MPWFVTGAVKYRKETDSEFCSFVEDCVRRFKKRDYGDVDEEQKMENRNARKTGCNIIGIYGEGNNKINIITCDEGLQTWIVFDGE